MSVPYRGVLLAEWIKLRSIRANLALIASAIALPALLAPLIATEIAADPEALSGDLEGTVPALVGLTGLILACMAAAFWTAEHAHSTIDATYVCVPTRGRVMVAKAIVIAAVATLSGLVTFGVTWIATDVAVDGLDIHADGVTTGSAISLIAIPLVALTGLAVGIVVRNTAAALGGMLIWCLLLETFGAAALAATGFDRAAGWLPYRALTNATLPVPEQPNPGRLAAVVLFSVVAAAIACVGARRESIGPRSHYSPSWMSAR